MLRHECYDEYGKLVAAFNLEIETCEAIIIEHEGKYYQPKCYMLHKTPNVAKCIPVKVKHCKSGECVDHEPVR